MMNSNEIGSISGKKETKKDSTRQKIVSKAASILRERGLSGAGIDNVMAAAGLTHGAFYAHFQNKTALVKEAVHRAFDEAKYWLFAAGLDQKGASWISAASKRYLRREHVDNLAGGCVVVALSGELSRADQDVRGVYTERVQDIVAEIMARIGDGDNTPEIQRKRALTLFSLWVGALTIARPLTDPALVEELLATVRVASEELWRSSTAVAGPSNVWTKDSIQKDSAAI